MVNIPVTYRIFDSRAGNDNIYNIRKLSETIGVYPFVKLLQTTRNMSITSDLDPSQAKSNPQASFNKRSTDTLLRDETSKSTDVYLLELAIGGKTEVIRNVILQNISYQDSIGTPVQWSFDLVAASKILIAKQTPPVVTGVEDGVTYITSVTPEFEGTATLSVDGASANSFTSGTEISINGTYILIVTGDNGIQVTINFIIAIP
jgi:hypothetical protein